MRNIRTRSGHVTAPDRDTAPSRGVLAGGLAGLLACALLATGCSGSGSTTAEPGPSDTGAPAPSASATPTPTLTSYGTVEEQKKTLPKSRDGMQTGAVMGRAVAATPEEAAVADAWLRYWQVRARAFMDMKIPTEELNATTSGEARQEIITGTTQRKNVNTYTQGSIILNPTRITVSGKQATLLDCAITDSRDVYSDGTQERGGTKTYGFRVALTKVQGSWYTKKITLDKKLCTNEGTGL